MSKKKKEKKHIKEIYNFYIKLKNKKEEIIKQKLALSNLYEKELNDILTEEDSEDISSVLDLASKTLDNGLYKFLVLISDDLGYKTLDIEFEYLINNYTAALKSYDPNKPYILIYRESGYMKRYKQISKNIGYFKDFAVSNNFNPVLIKPVIKNNDFKLANLNKLNQNKVLYKEISLKDVDDTECYLFKACNPSSDITTLKIYKDLINNQALENIVDNINDILKKLNQIEDLLNYYKSKFDEEKLFNDDYQEKLNNASKLLNNY